MNNIRLDYINNIDPAAIDLMRVIRKEYIDLDVIIQEIEDHLEDRESPANRTIDLARTHLEISLQFAIKSLCLIGEIK